MKPNKTKPKICGHNNNSEKLNFVAPRTRGAVLR
jgi:hypothetical protein